MLIRPQAVIFVLGGVVVNSAAGDSPLMGSAEVCQTWVDCENGLVVGETNTTCHDDCKPVGGGSGNCCTDPLDCNGFTGKVCADEGQLSCATVNGTVDPGCDPRIHGCVYAGACENATIPRVVDSCVGPFSCKLAGYNGNIGNMANSCRGYAACDYMASDEDSALFTGSTVGHLTDSCNSLFACSGMAENGTVGTVTDSCNDGDRACSNMAIEGGTVGDLINSCNNGDSACNFLAAYEGSIGEMAYSCNADFACNRVQCKVCDPNSTSPGIDFMNGSCNTDNGCIGYMGDAAGSGLTCTANSTAPVTFSPDTITCTDTGSEEVSTCDGNSDVCTSLCPAGDAYIPTNYWVPPLDKPGMTCEAVRLKIPDHGEFSCLPIGEGICRDNGGAFGEWRFGIEEVETPPCEVTSKCRIDTETNTFPVLIDPANTRYPITGTTFTNSETGNVCKNGLNEAIRGCNYAGTTHICISENIESDPNRYSDERPYMFFYDEKSHQYLYQLVCDGIGEEGKLPELKMVNNGDLADATYVNYPVDVVKFKKGATPDKDDANELWRMYVDWNGFEDPETRRIGKLASFIGVANPKLCKEYVSATDKPCWKEKCDDVETPEDYERVDCEPIP